MKISKDSWHYKLLTKDVLYVKAKHEKVCPMLEFTDD